MNRDKNKSKQPSTYQLFESLSEEQKSELKSLQDLLKESSKHKNNNKRTKTENA